MHALELSTLLHRALEARVEHLVGLLESPWQESPERLHQVRVASRRVRSALAMVDPGLYPAFRRQGRRLRSFTRALGMTREMDVHALLLEELGERIPGLATGSALEHALEVLEGRRRKARKAMARALKGRPLRSLGDLLKVPSFPDPFLPGDLATDVWAALDPHLEAAFSPIPGLLDREDIPALHGARIRIKRFRYALEVVASAFPAPPDAELAHLRELQTALGRHHDRATLEAHLLDQYQELQDRRRKTLASGTLEVISYVGEARLQAFERFRTAARAMDLPGFRAALRRALALSEEEDP